MGGRLTKNILSTRSQSHWRSLYYFNLYRLVLGVAFVTIAISGGQFASLGERYPTLFFGGSLALVVMAVISLITITRGWPPFGIQVLTQFSLDVILITVLGSASGGITSGLHLLVLVSVAAAGIAMPGRISLFFPALGTILAFAEHSTSLLTHQEVAGAFTHVGILGIALFSTSLLINFISARLEQVEAVAQRSASDLYKLSKLNQLVVARLDTGILVVDQHGNLQLSNERAQDLLNFEHASTLEDLSPQLHDKFIEWQQDRCSQQIFQPNKHGPNIALKISPVSDQKDANVVIFLEDLSQTEQHAHQLKLAALGRLTSAVAHEIRNPLGAISHAGQLINESKDLNPADRRLVDIVNEQSDRLNQIIKSILNLGRPQLSEPVPMNLDKWLTQFRKNFVQTHDCGSQNLDIRATALEVRMDPDHLHQIMTNLCENAIRHGKKHNGKATKVRVSGGHSMARNVSFLDVRNEGPTIPDEIQNKIFEPFFTTEDQGTGLGLYLARELCQDNNARLDYVKTSADGCFRIQFQNQA